MDSRGNGGLVPISHRCAGERPFSGSATATMHKVLEEDPLPPSRFNVQVPGAMDAVVRRALAKRPEANALVLMTLRAEQQCFVVEGTPVRLK